MYALYYCLQLIRYTGHCAQNRDRVGKSYGIQTHKLLIDPCINHAPELIVAPIDAKPDLKDYPTQNELRILHDREEFVDSVYKHPIIPGYAGFVPNMFTQTGKRYVAAATAGVAQHETLMQRYRCDNRTLRHRDLLESGNGLFEHKLNERLVSLCSPCRNSNCNIYLSVTGNHVSCATDSGDRTIQRH